LTGVPIVSLLAFLGGVDPLHILAASFLTGLTVVGLSSVSILSSILCRTALGAILLTYGWTLAVFLPTSCVVVPAMAAATDFGLLAIVIIYSLFQGAVTIVCALCAVSGLRPRALAQSNPPSPWAESERPAILPLLFRQRQAQTEAAEPQTPSILPQLLRQTRQARQKAPDSVPWVEVVSLAEPDTHHPTGDDSWQESGNLPPYSPPALVNALRWKELYAEKYPHPGNDLDVLAGLKVVSIILAFIAVPLIAGRWANHGPGPGSEPWIQSLTIGLTFMIMLITALNSATRISRERERDTLSALLVLPVTGAEIVFTKWLGGVASARWFWLGYVVIWALGVSSGALSVCAVPLLAAVIGVYIGLTAAIGLWLSAVTSSLRATLLTVMLTLLVAAGPGKLVQQIEGPWLFDSQRSSTWWAPFLDFSLTPTTVLSSLSYRTLASDAAPSSVINREPPPAEPPAFGQRYDGWMNGIASYYSWRRIVYAVVGVPIYLALMIGLLCAANRCLLASRGARRATATGRSPRQCE
jgi:ABC-type transport system involved in multi-copper enzyme maturation permease subunit